VSSQPFPSPFPDAALQARAEGINALDYLVQRGYVQDVSDADGLRKQFASGPVTAYIGFDPTARSLHVGNLLGIMMLSVLQRFGHRPIALGGGGTALVGDPSGKTSTRNALAPESIWDNLRGILPQFGRHLDFDGGRFGDAPAALLVNNADWLLELRYIEFLRDIGRHFSVNEMIAVETYRQRIETTGLNFVEFNYRIVQAYDFLHLFRTMGCKLQLGGSDQWGNIVAGVDLIRRVEGGEAYAVVSPLLTTASGQKLGKSEGNSVWLDREMTTPYQYYQYWVNVDDADVERLLKLFTFLPEERIAELCAVEGAALREAKRVLAVETTTLNHGRAAAEEADAAARALFGAGGKVAIDDPNVPTATIAAADVAAGLSVAEAFVRAGLCASRGEARRLAQQGGVSIDDERIDDVDQPFTPGDPRLFRVGKKKYMRVVID
jgi:tyrosyl-tRNA synthetase